MRLPPPAFSHTYGAYTGAGVPTAPLVVQGAERAKNITGRRMTIYLRTTVDLHKWLNAEAKKSNRSLNQQVEWILMQWREGEQTKPLLEELRKIVEGARKK